MRLRQEIPAAERELNAIPKAIDTEEKQRLLLYTGVQKAVDDFKAAMDARDELRSKDLRVCARANQL